MASSSSSATTTTTTTAAAVVVVAAAAAVATTTSTTTTTTTFAGGLHRQGKQFELIWSVVHISSLQQSRGWDTTPAYAGDGGTVSFYA